MMNRILLSVMLRNYWLTSVINTVVVINIDDRKMWQP